MLLVLFLFFVGGEGNFHLSGDWKKVSNLSFATEMVFPAVAHELRESDTEMEGTLVQAARETGNSLYI